MIIDSSAILSILTLEDDALVFADAMEMAESLKMSAATFLEASMVIDAKRSATLSWKFDDFLQRARIEIVPLTVHQARIARAAFRDYGRGSGSPAKLNFGDCLAYALAIDSGEPLLFKGNDFTHTDVGNALVESGL